MSGKDPIDEDDESLLLEIEDVQTVSLEGLDHSLGISVSEKAQKMSDLIAKGNCNREYSEPSFNFSTTWTGRAGVRGGAECPVSSTRTWGYDKSADAFSMTDTFQNKSDAYKKLDRVISKSFLGDLDATAGPDGSLRINGRFVLSLEVADLGRVNAEIETKQLYRGNTGDAALKMTMVVADQEKYVVDIKWNAAFSPKYELNGRASDRKTIDKFFSQLHLNEMIDWSRGLRGN